MHRYGFLFLILFAVGCTAQENQKTPANAEEFPYQLTQEQWKAKLTEEQYDIMRKAGTEQAFTGKYWDNKKAGIYRCAGCDQELFSSKTKYKSGTGWPSFWSPIRENAVKNRSDFKYGMVRTEVVCSNCGSHLGHVFDDGPKPTGLRYCLNSAALSFESEESSK